MLQTVTGVIHGRTIELPEDLGLPDGQEVRVTIQSAEASWGEGIRQSASAWAYLPELDAIFDQIQRDRKVERRSQDTP